MWRQIVKTWLIVQIILDMGSVNQTVLQCGIIFHWLSPHPEWSLLQYKCQTLVSDYYGCDDVMTATTIWNTCLWTIYKPQFFFRSLRKLNFMCTYFRTKCHLKQQSLNIFITDETIPLFWASLISKERNVYSPFNSLWPSDAIWHRSRATLAQIIACCLTAPRHYLNQCWLIICKALLHSSEGNFPGNAQNIYPWYQFQND